MSDPEILPIPDDDLPVCPHTHWTVLAANRIGDGYCYDCCRPVLLTILFNSLRTRMLETIAKYERAIAEVKRGQ